MDENRPTIGRKSVEGSESDESRESDERCKAEERRDEWTDNYISMKGDLRVANSSSNMGSRNPIFTIHFTISVRCSFNALFRRSRVADKGAQSSSSFGFWSEDSFKCWKICTQGFNDWLERFDRSSSVLMSFGISS